MNSNGWKTIGVIALVCLIIFGILSLFISALPFILLVVAVVWIIRYISKLFNKNKSEGEYKYSNVDDNRTIYNEGEDEGEVIDVEYKDVE